MRHELSPTAFAVPLLPTGIRALARRRPLVSVNAGCVLHVWLSVPVASLCPSAHAYSPALLASAFIRSPMDEAPELVNGLIMKFVARNV